MACLAIDMLAGVAVDGVVADEEDGPVGDDMRQDEAGQSAAEPEARPGGPLKGTLMVGPVPGGELPERA
jgi:hypothetical protein